MKVGDLVVRNMGRRIVFHDMKGIVLDIRQVDNETYYKVAWAKEGKIYMWRREELTLIQSAK